MCALCTAPPCWGRFSCVAYLKRDGIILQCACHWLDWLQGGIYSIYIVGCNLRYNAKIPPTSTYGGAYITTFPAVMHGKSPLLLLHVNHKQHRLLENVKLDVWTLKWTQCTLGRIHGYNAQVAVRVRC